MYTLGYRFRPWREAKAIADGPSILRYIRETAQEYGIDRKIRYGHQVKAARWSSADAAWTVEATKADGSAARFTCNFLYMCSGYYDYAGGYMPGWPGMEKFRGRIVHPQKWPEDLEHKDQRVVVIGSGATSVTLVPAMAEAAKHVYMLQRSPSYVLALPSEDLVASWLRGKVPAGVAYTNMRAKKVLSAVFFFQKTRRKKKKKQKRVLVPAAKQLG